MTNEELRMKYRLVKLVDDHEVRTYHAENAAGHLVMVHFLPPSPDDARLFDLLDSLNSVDRRRVVERLEVDGAQVLVTEYLQGFQSLQAWLETRPRQGRTPVPGEFTRIFGRMDASKLGGHATPRGEPPASPLEGHESARGWTALFGPGSAPPVAEPSAGASPRRREPPAGAPPPDPRPPKSAETPPTKKPVVRWREQPPDASRSAPPAAPPPQRAAGSPRSSPGDMTQLFGPPDGRLADPLSAQGVQPPVAGHAADPPAGSPVGFTQLFGHGKAPDQSQAIPPDPLDYVEALRVPVARPPIGAGRPPEPSGTAHPVPPAPDQQPGEFTRLMSGMSSPPPAPAVPGAGAARPPVSSAPPGGRSEFTGIVSATAPPAATPPAAQPDPVDLPAAPSPRRLFVLIVALCVVGLLAVLLTFIVVLHGTR